MHALCIWKSLQFLKVQPQKNSAWPLSANLLFGSQCDENVSIDTPQVKASYPLGVVRTSSQGPQSQGARRCLLPVSGERRCLTGIPRPEEKAAPRGLIPRDLLFGVLIYKFRLNCCRNFGLVRFIATFPYLSTFPTGQELKILQQQVRAAKGGQAGSSQVALWARKTGKIALFVGFLNSSIGGLSRNSTHTLEKSNALLECICEFLYGQLKGQQGLVKVPFFGKGQKGEKYMEQEFHIW